jgi:hypothetical protein
MLSELEELKQTNFPNFCEALDLNPSSEQEVAPLLDVLKWFAQDHLFNKYGIEIEELYFFLDHYENCFG